MNMWNKFLLVAGVAALCGVSEAAKTASAMSSAVNLKSSQTVKLVAEYVEDYDPDVDDAKYDSDSGVYYLKAKLTKGAAYTIWISGGSAASIDLDVDTDWDDDNAPMASFDVSEMNDGALKVAYLYADDWDADDSSGTYYVCLSGDVGLSTTVYFQQGIRSFSQTGDENSPKSLSFSTTQKTWASKCIEGSYYMTASLKAGLKYRVRTLKGTANASLTLDVDSSVDFDIYADVAYSNNYNEAWIIVPAASGKFTFLVQGDTDTQAFSFVYRQVPTLAIGSHKAYTLKAANNYTASFVPGRISNSENYYDQIVDEHLCLISLTKGQKVVFETSGATAPLQMLVYDPTGKILVSNDTMGNGNLDCRGAIAATVTGTYYVGVYNPAFGIADAVSGDPIDLTATFAEEFPVADAWDSGDDLYTGATTIVPYPAATNELPEVVGSVNGPHQLNGGDWYDCFKMPCRKGYTYSLAALPTDLADVSDLSLGYKVFTLLGGKEKTVTNGVDLAEGVTFKATTNAVHYIRTYVYEGRGLDYPNFDLYASVSAGTNRLGLVEVESRGVEGTFSIGTEKFTYPVGLTLALPQGARTVKFNAVSGFTAPASQTVDVVGWADWSEERTAAEEPVELVVGDYTDNYEEYKVSTTKTVNKKKVTTTTTYYDAELAGAVSIVVTNSVKSYRRAFYADDVADTFKFNALAGWCYNLDLVDTTYATNGVAGDMVMTVSNAVLGVVATNVTSISKLPLAKGVTFVTVTHRDSASPVDGSYTLKTSAANVGFVKFSSPTFIVKESAEYAQLTVMRTQKEGALTVHYATVAGTAAPGSEYYPTNGVLSWADGNKANKTICVRLIPDAVPTWEVAKSFNVALWPNARADFATAEYPVTFSGTNVAAVTISEVTAKKPGTVSVAYYGEGEPGDDDVVAVSSTAKPVVQVTAGNPLVLHLTRTGGTNGTVAVKLTTPVVKTNTAVAGKDFENLTTDNIVVWEDGDDAEKTVTLNTFESWNYVQSKTFAIKLAALTTGAYAGCATPTLASTQVTAKILSDTVSTTGAAFAKTVAGVGGIAMTSTGTWFVDAEGNLRSGTGNGTLTYTLTGPGFFALAPYVDSGDSPDDSTAKLICRIDKEGAIPCSGSNAVDRIVRVLAAGTHTVTLSFTGGNGSEFATFENAWEEDNDLPFKWVRFAKTTVATPWNKAVLETNDVKTLAWNLAEGLENEDVAVRVRFGTTAVPTAVIWNEAELSADPEPESDLNACDLPAELIVPGKTYYWALDYAYADTNATTALKWVAGPSTWSFSTLGANAPVTDVSGQDVYGADISAAQLEDGTYGVDLIQGVKASLRIGGSCTNATYNANRYRLVSGKLPTGVTLNATTGKLSGCPTTAGTYNALLQSYNAMSVTKTVNKKKVTTTTNRFGTTVPVTFTVAPIGTAAGTFRAAVTEDGSVLGKLGARNGFVTFTASAAGALSASVKIAGNTFKFTGTGYDALSGSDESAIGCTRSFEVRLRNITLVKTVAYTNYLSLVVNDGATTNSVALAEAAGEVKALEMNVPNALLKSATSVTPDVTYAGALYRANGGLALGKSALAPFAGYYTVALVPTGVSAAEGLPTGNGYLTLTIGTTGGVTYAGVLADGTAMSGSSVASVQGDDLESPLACTAEIPFHWGDTVRSLAGVLTLKWVSDGEGAGAMVADSTATLKWCRDAAAAATRDATGYTIEVAPTGGWYDKVVNLQRYYLDYDLSIEAAGGDDLPYEALPTGYSFGVDATPNDLALKLTGNTASVAARKLVTESSTRLYDLAVSVNPWAVTYSYTRATGIVTGTFSCWREKGTSAQSQLTKIPHKGVMLFNRDSASPLAEDVWSAGFFLMPATTSWKASLPFNVIATPADRDWTETAVPVE